MSAAAAERAGRGWLESGLGLRLALGLRFGFGLGLGLELGLGLGLGLWLGLGLGLRQGLGLTLGLELRLGFVSAPTVSRFASLEFFCAWLSWATERPSAPRAWS